jgi:hypothetical protein
MNGSTGLTDAEARAIVAWLGVPSPEPSKVWLDALLAAYTQRVPWESASRIARRAVTREHEACVQEPRAFWHAAMTQGLGGTCFESNRACAALIAALGWHVALTINDMPPIRGCHTALLVTLDGHAPLLVDVGYPLYASVPLYTDRAGSAESAWGTCTAIPIDTARFRIEQHPRPRPVLFELIAAPVAPAVYAAATTRDYAPGGLFLDRVIIKKIVDGDAWRFASHEPPRVLERFRGGIRTTHPLPSDDDRLADVLAAHFSMDAGIIRRALAAIAKIGAD